MRQENGGLSPARQPRCLLRQSQEPPQSNLLDLLRAVGFHRVCRGVKPAGTVQRSNFNARMFSFDSLGHINVVVPDLKEATRFYQTLFNASVEQTFPHFKNVGFARSAGFLEDPESVDVSIRFLKIPFGRSEDLFMELFTFHSPAGGQEIKPSKTNDVGGPRHVCLRVRNIDECSRM